MKTTQVRTGATAKRPTQQGDRLKIPDRSVGPNQLRLLGVERANLADDANVFPWVTAGFQNYVKVSNLTPFNGSPGTGQFRTYGIVNRASIPDLANDAGVRFGVNRICIQRVFELNAESGPNGEKVYGALNDSKNQFRFVGTWVNSAGGDGVRVQADIQNDFIEAVFEGTGLNLLVNPVDQAGTSYIANVDGGADSADLTTATGQSTILQSRNTTANVILPVVSGLTYGLHTVKIRLSTVGNGLFCQGFEILTEASTLKVNAGTVMVNGKQVTVAASSPAFSSGFTNVYGTPGTRGGHVLTYFDASGNFKKDIQYTDTSSLTILSGSNPVDHTNEEVSRVYNFREFSAGRFTTADDFGSLTPSTADKYFTLDDGTTTLVADDVQADLVGIKEALVLAQTANSEWCLTFVGSGIDIFQAHTATPTVAFPTVFIDNVNVASGSGVSWGTRNWVKIASGLPYGTHTLRINQVSGGTALRISDFRIYSPKIPTLPDNCIVDADYFLLGAYTFNGTDSHNDLSQGIIWKQAARELTYTGTWVVNGTGDYTTSGSLLNNTGGAGSTFGMPFFGTGFDLVYTNTGSGVYTLQVDGVAYTVASTATAGSFVAGTSTLTITGAGALSITGLTLGFHTFKFTKTSGAGNDGQVVGVGIQTPIYSPKFNLFGDLQNTIPVGSCALSDNRKFSALKELVSTFKSWNQATATDTVTTTATTLVVMPSMQVTVEVKEPGSKLVILFSASMFNTGANNAQNIRIYIDGVPVGSEKSWQQATGSGNIMSNDSLIVPVSPGEHTVQVFYRTNGGTQSAANRNLSVFEI